MEIKKEKSGTNLLINISGSLNTQTAPDLEASIKESFEGITEMTIDMKELDYISSAGLRVLLTTQNHMDDTNGKLVIKNAGEEIMEVFEMTGFSSILTIE